MYASFRSPARVRGFAKITVALAAAVSAFAAASPSASAAGSGQVDTWIQESLVVLHSHAIPGSYAGIFRTIMRESSGDLYAINLWDSNALDGHPSKGLMQVIDPTFNAYHVAGTSWNIYDPVANISAACNYAEHVYGSIDNVYSAY